MLRSPLILQGIVLAVVASYSSRNSFGFGRLLLFYEETRLTPQDSPINLRL